MNPICSNRQNFQLPPNTCLLFSSFDQTFKLVHLKAWWRQCCQLEWKLLVVDVRSDWLHFPLYFGATYALIQWWNFSQLCYPIVTVRENSISTFCQKKMTTFSFIHCIYLLQQALPISHQVKTRRQTLCCCWSKFWSLGWVQVSRWEGWGWKMEREKGRWPALGWQLDWHGWTLGSPSQPGLGGWRSSPPSHLSWNHWRFWT